MGIWLSAGGALPPDGVQHQRGQERREGWIETSRHPISDGRPACERERRYARYGSGRVSGSKARAQGRQQQREEREREPVVPRISIEGGGGRVSLRRCARQNYGLLRQATAKVREADSVPRRVQQRRARQ